MQTLKKVIISENQTFLYNLKQKLGKGKNGEVFVGHFVNSQTPFAIKVCPIQFSEQESKPINRLIKHPNIIKFQNYWFNSQKNAYILMQLCEGSLNTNIKQSAEKIRDIFFQLVQGLKAIVQSGIVHRDIKPTNILVKNKLYKYADFGSAVQIKYQGPRLGTLNFCAPQIFKSENIACQPSLDVFSLGVTLYQLITQKHPYLNKIQPVDYNTFYSSKPKLKLISRQARYNCIFGLFDVIQRMVVLQPENRISHIQLFKFIQQDEMFQPNRQVDYIKQDIVAHKLWDPADFNVIQSFVQKNQQKRPQEKKLQIQVEVQQVLRDQKELIQNERKNQVNSYLKCRINLLDFLHKFTLDIEEYWIGLQQSKLQKAEFKSLLSKILVDVKKVMKIVSHSTLNEDKSYKVRMLRQFGDQKLIKQLSQFGEKTKMTFPSETQTQKLLQTSKTNLKNKLISFLKNIFIAVEQSKNKSLKCVYRMMMMLVASESEWNLYSNMNIVQQEELFQEETIDYILSKLQLYPEIKYYISSQL